MAGERRGQAPGPGRPVGRVRVPETFAEQFPDGSPRATECFLTLGLVATTMLADLNRLLERFDVPSSTAFNALTVLAGAGHPLPPSAIARRMVVARPTLTGVLKSLEQRRLVVRAPHRSDGRMQLVELSDRGRRTVARALPEVHRFEAELFGGLDDGELVALADKLAVVAERLPSRHGAPGSAPPGRRGPG